MEQIKQVIKQMISVSKDELNDFLSQGITKTFKHKEILSRPNGVVADDVLRRKICATFELWASYEL